MSDRHPLLTPARPLTRMERRAAWWAHGERTGLFDDVPEWFRLEWLDTFSNPDADEYVYINGLPKHHELLFSYDYGPP